jgi:uncharacterized protein (TIGR03000 family)
MGSCHGTVITSEVWGASCHGSSCFGSSCHGSSCFGSSCHGGGFGSTGVPHGVMMYEGEVITMPSVGTVKLEPEDKDDAANIRIEMPRGAKLYVDGQLIETVNGHFHTPKLPRGKSYYYEMKAEMMVDGKNVIEEKKVLVQAGQTTVENFGQSKLVSR